MGRLNDAHQRGRDRDLRRRAETAEAGIRALADELANDFSASAEDVETCRDAADVIEALLRETAR